MLRRIATVAAALPSAPAAARPRFYLGVDPGLAGAVAVLDARGRPVQLAGIPLRLERGRRVGYDLAVIRALLEPWRDVGTLAVVERPGPMPPRRAGLELGGSLANYARGLAEGWSWMLAGLGWPEALVLAVHPRTWQADLLGDDAGDTGARALAAVRRRWPRLDLRRTARCSLPEPGRVDALLLAEHGRRRFPGDCYATA
jgi:hypothetical protein